MNTEIYILNMIKIFKSISDAERICNNDKTDIQYKLINEIFYRSLQVKTLSKHKNGCWQIKHCNKYKENTLIVGCNIEKDKFILIWSQNCTKSGDIRVRFNDKVNNKYKDKIFTDIDEFKKKFEEMLKLSIPYEQELSENCLQENDSLERLYKECELRHYEVKRPESGGSIYDPIINNYKIQHKSTNNKNGKQYKVNIKKNGGRINGEQTYIPYNENDDIDYIIIEIITYPGNFYIIPKQEMINHKIFSSSESKGQDYILYSTSRL